MTKGWSLASMANYGSYARWQSWPRGRVRASSTSIEYRVRAATTNYRLLRCLSLVLRILRTGTRQAVGDRWSTPSDMQDERRHRCVAVAVGEGRSFSWPFCFVLHLRVFASFSCRSCLGAPISRGRWASKETEGQRAAKDQKTNRKSRAVRPWLSRRVGAKPRAGKWKQKCGDSGRANETDSIEDSKRRGGSELTMRQSKRTKRDWA